MYLTGALLFPRTGAQCSLEGVIYFKPIASIYVLRSLGFAEGKSITSERVGEWSKDVICGADSNTSLSVSASLWRTQIGPDLTITDPESAP
jgi:hypothetical protein